MKAQASTEYLIMLAIVTVIVLVSAMFFTNIPSVISQLSSSGHKDFWYNADIGVQSHAKYENGTFLLNLRNNKASSVTVESVYLNNVPYRLNMALQPGEKKVASLSLPPSSAGDTYVFRLGFRYLMLGESFEYQPDVQVSGTVQE